MSNKLTVIQEEVPWYHEGLHFKCTECGQCCTGSPGYIWVTEQEIIEIAHHLQLTIEEFYHKYIRIVGDKISLLEDPKNFDCIFLKNKKCQIYTVRPKQCRTFPWWPQHLKTKKDWEEAAQYCEGIRFLDAPLVPYETIQTQLEIQKN